MYVFTHFLRQRHCKKTPTPQRRCKIAWQQDSWGQPRYAWNRRSSVTDLVVLPVGRGLLLLNSSLSRLSRLQETSRRSSLLDRCALTITSRVRHRAEIKPFEKLLTLALSFRWLGKVRKRINICSSIQHKTFRNSFLMASIDFSRLPCKLL